MSIKIGTVDPLELLDPADLDDDTAKPDKRIHIYVRHTQRPPVIELVSECCALSISDARCLVSLLELAIRQAELRVPAFFPCGCSRLKVEAGKCDAYGPDGRGQGVRK